MIPKIHIRIDTSSAAFGSGRMERNIELKRILSKIIEDLDQGRSIYDQWPLLDLNGNTVGSLSAEEK